MAAHYWRLLLFCEIGCATAMAALLRLTLDVSLIATALAAFAALLLLPAALVGVSLIAGRIVGPDSDFPSAFMEGLRAWACESVALTRAMGAMSLEPWRRFVYDARPGGASQTLSPVLLIHGVVCNRGVWRPLAGALWSHGFGPIRGVNLEPPLADIESHVAHVVSELRQLRRDSGGARVAIVAHSMGGLVARAVLRLAGADDIGQVITLGSPHHGAWLARLLPGPPNRQMQPDSEWLAALNAAQEGHFPVPVACIYSVNDNLVTPARSAVLAGAQQIELRGLGHLSLLSARPAIDCTLAALTSLRAGREPCLS